MTATLLTLVAKGFATVLLTALLTVALTLAGAVAINPAHPLLPQIRKKTHETKNRIRSQRANGYRSHRYRPQEDIYLDCDLQGMFPDARHS